MQHSMAPNLPCGRDDLDRFLSAPSPAAIRVAETLAGPVAVLGAGGKMGLHMAVMLRRALEAAGRSDVPVTGVSRFGAAGARHGFERAGVQTLAADLLDDEAIGRLPDFQTVYFLAGIKFGTADRADALRRSNEELPARVAARFPQARFVAFSTGCVYPYVTPASGGSRESDAPAPIGDYAVSCLGREGAFAAAAASRGTPVVLIRLNYAVEFRYGVLVDIARKVLEGSPIDVTMGHVNLIWQRDAVDHILQAVSLAASPAAVLNVAGLPIVSVRDLAHRFGALFDREPVIVGNEESTAWLSNPAKAHDLFGPPQVTLDEAVEWTAAWLAAGGETLGKPTKFECRNGAF
jgi:nucleoside-diphosphate-sugar epimerase